MTVFSIDREPMLSFMLEQGHLFLSVQVYDDDDRRVLWIDRNELRYSLTPWDITFVGRTLTIREGPRQFLLEIAFQPPNRVDILRGRFKHNGLELLVVPDGIGYANCRNIVYGSYFYDFDVGINVGDPIESGVCAVQWSAANRGIVNRAETDAWLRSAVCDMKKSGGGETNDVGAILPKRDTMGERE